VEEVVSQYLPWLERLQILGEAVRRRVLAAGGKGAGELSRVVACEGGDCIFAIDREVEPVIAEGIASWPRECLPLLLIAEGFGSDGRRRIGPEDEPLRYRLLVDPIDGSRGLMYDKRSAWFLAAVAPDRGEATSLADAVAAVMVELPTRKQGWVDTYLAASDLPTRCRRSRTDGSNAHEVAVQPSTATDLLHGFGHVVSFFPGTKVLAARLLERIVAATLGENPPGGALVFDDQYISSGGQMAELIAGHDRFCCDLRPLFHRILERHEGCAVCGLECHPYDVAGALAARQAGVILTDGFGGPLNPPFNVNYPVHWCGYANEALRRSIEPVLADWLQAHDVRPDVGKP
jgi:fructose-1,6-bisphosphatase/inositol monophosphatase family enzyme